MIGCLGHRLLQRIGGIVGITHNLSLLGTQLGYLDNQREGIVLACAISTMDSGLEYSLAQFAIVETGQRSLLGGIDNDDGIRCLASPTLCILGTLGNISL